MPCRSCGSARAAPVSRARRSLHGDRPSGGFSDAEIEEAARILPALSLVAYRIGLLHVATETLGAYLGPQTGGRVLQGKIRRGDSQVISAAPRLLGPSLRPVRRWSVFSWPAWCQASGGFPRIVARTRSSSVSLHVEQQYPCRPRLADIRIRALLLSGFASTTRRSELAALDVEDIEETAEGLRVTIRRSKTDQEGHGHVIAIPRGVIACPVAALKAWA